MAKTRLFVIRHGRTMFNTIGRAQGWSDTPLTAEGERGFRLWESACGSLVWSLLELIPAIQAVPFRLWGSFSMNWD